MVSSRKKILSFAITALGLLTLFLVAVNIGSLKVMPLELFKGLFIEHNENVRPFTTCGFPASSSPSSAARQPPYPACFCRP